MKGFRNPLILCYKIVRSQLIGFEPRESDFKSDALTARPQLL